MIGLYIGAVFYAVGVVGTLFVLWPELKEDIALSGDVWLTARAALVTAACWPLIVVSYLVQETLAAIVNFLDATKGDD